MCTILRWFSNGYSVKTRQQFLSPPTLRSTQNDRLSWFVSPISSFWGESRPVKLGYLVYELQDQIVAFCRGEKVRDDYVTSVAQLLTKAVSRITTSKTYIVIFWLYFIKM